MPNEQRLSCQKFDRRVAGLTRGLRGAGAERGDRVGIYLDASGSHALAILGSSRSSGVYMAYTKDHITGSGGASAPSVPGP